jgi:hypothetical protein
MYARAILSPSSRAAVIAGLAVILPLSGLALARTSGATLSVTVFPDRFISAGVPFVGLDALEALVAPANPSVLRLDACGPESANALLAAAERFRDRYQEIRVLAVTDATCAAVAGIGVVRVSQVGDSMPTGAVSAPTRRYWQRVLP